MEHDPNVSDQLPEEAPAEVVEDDTGASTSDPQDEEQNSADDAPSERATGHPHDAD